MKLRPNPDVIHERLENEAVLVHLRTNRIYTLNPTGTRYWELLAEGHDRPAIRSRLLEEFDVSAEELDRELDRIASELLSEGLVRAADRGS